MLTMGKKCACSLLEEINIFRFTLSHHVKTLCDSGIANGRKKENGCFLLVNHVDAFLHLYQLDLSFYLSLNLRNSTVFYVVCFRL